MRSSALNYGLALAWTLGILLACSIPGPALPSEGAPGLDKVAHAALFAGFALLWLRAAGLHRVGAVALAGIVYAVFTEVYQGWLPWERSPDPYDALADVLGVVAGIGVALGHRRFVRRRKAA